MDDIIYRQNNELFEYKVMLGYRIGMQQKEMHEKLLTVHILITNFNSP